MSKEKDVAQFSADFGNTNTALRAVSAADGTSEINEPASLELTQEGVQLRKPSQFKEGGNQDK